MYIVYYIQFNKYTCLYSFMCVIYFSEDIVAVCYRARIAWLVINVMKGNKGSWCEKKGWNKYIYVHSIYVYKSDRHP